MADVSLDTNVLLYAEGLRKVAEDDAKIARAATLIDEIAERGDRMVLAAQVIAELHHGLTKYLRLDRGLAAERISRWLAVGTVSATTDEGLRDAFQLAADHDLQTYDAIILSACAQASCDRLYSEDLQHGFTWRGVRVVNPFV